MFISVNMNPAVDKTIKLDELKPGMLNRIISQSVTAGGKGINVANDICAMGGEVVLTGIMGCQNTDILDQCLSDLERKGVKVDFYRVNGRNRTNIKLIEESGRLTEINEPGFAVSGMDVNNFTNKLLSYAEEGNTFIITGSVPLGVDSDYYGFLTRVLKEKGATVIIDADGPILKRALDSKPSIIKPNEFELLNYFGDKNLSEKLLISRAKELNDAGVELVIVSRGSKGSIFVTKDSVTKCNAVPVEYSSSVGAGDAMIAAAAYCDGCEDDYEELIKKCVAASAHTVTLSTPYFTDAAPINELKDLVILTEIER